MAGGGSITGANSVINKPYQYPHNALVAGLIFDLCVTLALISAMIWIWYINFGPGAKKRAERAAA